MSLLTKEEQALVEAVRHKVEPGSKCVINKRAHMAEWHGKRVDAVRPRDVDYDGELPVWLVRVVDELSPADRHQPGREISMAEFKLDVVECLRGKGRV